MMMNSAAAAAAAPAPRPTVHLDREALIDLSRPAPGRLLLQLAFEWACIAGLVVAAMHVASVSFSALCILLIATRQHALLTLMHEISHHQLSRHKHGLNDLVGDLFTAFPFFVTVHGFRRDHRQHHLHVSTDADPNWVSATAKERYRFPMARGRLLLEILKHCLGRYTLSDLKQYTVDSGMSVGLPAATRRNQVLFYAAVAGLATWLHFWPALLLYWIVPMFTFLIAILYVRDIAEHHGLPVAGILGSRTVLPNGLDRLVFAQNGVNFHAEHHLYPSVPFFRLERLHRRLLEDPHYRREAVLTRGYLTGLVTEVTGGR